jgi:F-type H+-transporting ATPase subunit alpha
VGSKAQSRAFKQVAAPLRLELAQFNALAAFSQFGSDLDEATQKRINRGKRIVEILKQPQFVPLDDLAETVVIHAAGSGILDEVPLEKIADFQARVMDHLRASHLELCAKIATGEKMEEATLKELAAAVGDFARTIR